MIFEVAEQDARRKCLGIWSGFCDVDGDGAIGFSDLLLVTNHFGEAGPDAIGDVNGDGKVDILDLITVGSRF